MRGSRQKQRDRSPLLSSSRKRGPITTGVSDCADVVDQRFSKHAARRMGPGSGPGRRWGVAPSNDNRFGGRGEDNPQHEIPTRRQMENGLSCVAGRRRRWVTHERIGSPTNFNIACRNRSGSSCGVQCVGSGQCSIDPGQIRSAASTGVPLSRLRPGRRPCRRTSGLGRPNAYPRTCSPKGSPSQW
jgi:hypothetical protein